MKKKNISDLSLDKIWLEKDLNNKDFINLNSFFWLFTLDLNSPKKDVQSTIIEWINKKYPDNTTPVAVVQGKNKSEARYSELIKSLGLRR